MEGEEADPVVPKGWVVKYSQSKEKMKVRKSEKLAQALERFEAGTAVEVIR